MESVRKNRFVPPGAYIDTQKKPMPFQEFQLTPESLKRGSASESRIPPAYHLLFGDSRCSCGMAYNKQSSEKEES